MLPIVVQIFHLGDSSNGDNSVHDWAAAVPVLDY